MTADIINLNKVRKAKARAEKERKADENRARSGRSKHDKVRSDDEAMRRQALLDGVKRDTRDTDDTAPAAGSGDDNLDPGSDS